jgi:uncharacterized membrane protein
MKYLTAYVIALILFLVLDVCWLSTVARSVYIPRIGDMMLDRPRWGVAAIFYLLYVAGLVYFAISHGWQAGNWRTAALDGALLGFFCYLTYNATNLSVMKGYDAVVAALDTAWGTLAGAIVAGGTVAILGLLGRTAPG